MWLSLKELHLTLHQAALFLNSLFPVLNRPFPTLHLLHPYHGFALGRLSLCHLKANTMRKTQDNEIENLFSQRPDFAGHPFHLLLPPFGKPGHIIFFSFGGEQLTAEIIPLCRRHSKLLSETGGCGAAGRGLLPVMLQGCFTLLILLKDMLSSGDCYDNSAQTLEPG